MPLTRTTERPLGDLDARSKATASPFTPLIKCGRDLIPPYSHPAFAERQAHHVRMNVSGFASEADLRPRAPRPDHDRDYLDRRTDPATRWECAGDAWGE